MIAGATRERPERLVGLSRLSAVRDTVPNSECRCACLRVRQAHLTPPRKPTFESPPASVPSLNFAFRSDPARTSRETFAELVNEQNGVFFGLITP
jgi:hypothetical protein